LAKVNDIYKDNIKAICQPGFRIIYTIPIAVLRDKFLRPLIETETNDQIVVMSVLKLFEKGQSRQPNSQPRPAAMDVLSEILNKRIASELLESETVEKIVLKSGGLLRELIRIANECCRICLREIRRQPEQSVIINDEVLEKAIDNIRNDFAIPLGEALREFPYPIILWLTNQMLVNLIKKAPDFWSWREGVFQFVSRKTITVSSQDIEPIRLVLNDSELSSINDDNQYLLPIEDLHQLIQQKEQQEVKDRNLATLYFSLGQIYQKRLEQGKFQDYKKE
jgi:hypothetical protein